MNIIINSKKYEIPEIDFNMICEIEEHGTSILNIKDKPFVTLRGILAVLMGEDTYTAGKELEQHIIKGGTLEETMETIMKALEKSDFFQAMSGNETTREVKR